jgi:uncharacterized protein
MSDESATNEFESIPLEGEEIGTMADGSATRPPDRPITADALGSSPKSEIMSIPHESIALAEEGRVQKSAELFPGPAEGSLLATAVEDRILAIDLLRGIALLGILIMNITAFGLPSHAYDDPTTAGGSTGLNRLVWFVVAVVFEGKMRALFSMLFGAGVILMTSRGEARGGGILVADLFMRRNLWLLLIGALHGYFIWSGDILFAYAVCGLMLFPFRNVRPWVLIGLGVLCLATNGPKAYLAAEGIKKEVRIAGEADAAVAAGKELTDEQKEARKTRDNLKHDPEKIRKEIEDHRGGYWKALGRRARETFKTQTVANYKFQIWDTLGMMLIGMGLYKLGVLSATLRRTTYLAMVVAGMGIGLAIGIPVALAQIRSNWDQIVSLGLNYATYDLRRLPMMIGYVGLVMLWFQSGLWDGIQRRLSAVGRMALTAYLGTSLLCMLLFDSLTLYGRLERYQLYFVVIAIWALWLGVCPWWLSRFRFGPVEWLWRSLTYAKLQPMRAAAVTPGVEA